MTTTTGPVSEKYPVPEQLLQPPNQGQISFVKYEGAVILNDKVLQFSGTCAGITSTSSGTPQNGENYCNDTCCPRIGRVFTSLISVC